LGVAVIAVDCLQISMRFIIYDVSKFFEFLVYINMLSQLVNGLLNIVPFKNNEKAFLCCASVNWIICLPVSVATPNRAVLHVLQSNMYCQMYGFTI